MLNFVPIPVLYTNRLKLRQLTDTDSKLFFDYMSDKANFPHVTMPIWTDIDQAIQYIQEKNDGIVQKKWYIWAITEKQTDKIMGTISIWNFNYDEKKAELGYGLFPRNRKKGYMTEALNSVIQFGFENVGLQLIEVYTNTENQPSIVLLQRCGFVFNSNVIEEGEEYSIFKLINPTF